MMPISIMLKQRQRSIDIEAPDQQLSKKYFKQKQLRRKVASQTKSMQSIDTNRISIVIGERHKQNRRRKLLSIPVSDSKAVMTERLSPYEETSKKQTLEKKVIPFYINRNRADRTHTLDHQTVDLKENVIKGCIEQLQGILYNLHSEKSHRRIISGRVQTENDQTFIEKHHIQDNQTQNVQSKFQNYVKNICKLKENNKVLILNKYKPKHYHKLQDIKSTLDLNNHAATNATQRAKRTHRISLKENNEEEVQQKIKPPTIIKFIDNIEESSIDKINQSSFISDCGDKSIIKHLLPSQKKEFNQIEMKLEDCLDKKMIKVKNNKKLRNMFPCDFF